MTALIANGDTHPTGQPTTVLPPGTAGRGAARGPNPSGPVIAFPGEPRPWPVPHTAARNRGPVGWPVPWRRRPESDPRTGNGPRPEATKPERNGDRAVGPGRYRGELCAGTGRGSEGRSQPARHKPRRTAGTASRPDPAPAGLRRVGRTPAGPLQAKHAAFHLADGARLPDGFCGATP